MVQQVQIKRSVVVDLFQIPSKVHDMLRFSPAPFASVGCLNGWGMMVFLFLSCGVLFAAGEEMVTVTVEEEKAENVLPLNAPYVEAQLGRVVEVRKKLEKYREQQDKVLPARIRELNSQIESLAKEVNVGDDAEWKRLHAESLRLAALVKAQEAVVAKLTPGDFQSYIDFLSRDAELAGLNELKQQQQKVGREAQIRQRQLVAENEEGARLVNEVWTAEADLLTATRNRLDTQMKRDAVNRGTRSAIQRLQVTSPAPITAPRREIAVAAPEDAIERMARFKQRDSPGEVRALGERFFRQMDLGFPGLEEVAKLVEKEEYAAALDAYKVYFFSKKGVNAFTSAVEGTRGDDEIQASASVGLESDDESVTAADSASLPAAVIPPDPAAVAEAMDVAISAVLRVEKRQPNLVVARLGEPGAINWVFPDNAPGEISDELRLAQVELAHRASVAGKLGSVLLDSYVLTGNRDHLNRWVEITDDWSMNWPRDVDGSESVIRNYNMLIGYAHNYLVDHLRSSAELNPKLIEDMPSTTLARVLLAANAEYLSAAIRLMRSGQYNFRIMMLTGMIPYTLGMQEFYSMRWAAREATRLAELSMVHNIRRDGASAVLANAGHENTDGSFIGLPRVMAREKPDWLSPWWSEEFLLNLKNYTRYWFHLMKQDGRAYRISTSPLQDHFAPGGSIKVPLIQDEPEVRARMWKVYGQVVPYDDPESQRKIRMESVKGGDVPEPAVRSEYLPFAGYTFLRTGWEASDYFFYLHGINLPVASGRDDTNGYTLQGNGIVYLNAPPVFVDGRVQYAGHDLPVWSGAKSVFSVSAQPDEIKDTRFHTSEHFDLAESYYDKAYVYHPEHRKSSFSDIFGTYGMELVARRARREAETKGLTLDESPIRDVRHTRQVFSVPDRDLYIVTDLIDSDKSRRYDQKFGIAEPVSNDEHERRVELIKKENIDSVIVDPEQNSVKVRNPGYSGMDMFFLSNTPLSYQVTDPLAQKVPLKKQPPNAPVQYQRQLGVSWEVEGPSSVTTVIRPYRVFHDKEPEPALRNVRPIKGDAELSGFTAEFADGTPIYYAASTVPVRMNAGGVSVIARNLLVSGNRGIVLDGSAMEVDGKAIAVTHPDFEFSIEGSTIRVEDPIYRPIQPVTIAPATTVFVDKTEVSLTSETPGVEIRYTLDGSDVRHDSELYTAPFTISDTTWVKARAFRKGMTETPWTHDGTHATAQSWGIFEKVDYQPATTVGETQPGMSYEYLEDLWPVLMAEGPWLPAVKEGVVPTVLDVSPREGTKPFVMRYSGYLEVPEDGVYTFHAPPEFQFVDKESGYDLRVYINGTEWYPTSRWHAHGTWSVALQKGKHDFEVFYADMRRNPHREEMMWSFPKKDFVWQGTAPELKLSGPGMPPTVIPASMLSTEGEL